MSRWSTDRVVPAWLDAGFRPLFPLAALAAAVVVARIAAGFAGLGVTLPLQPLAWHAHEMLYGYAAAAISGFLLTAIPNWTGTERVRGWPLAVLAGAWLVARAGFWSGAPSTWVVLLDLAFLPAVLVVATRPLWSGGHARAWLPVGAVIALALAHAAWHAGREAGLPLLTDRATDTSVMLLALLVAIIGGRITPAFTRNRLRAAGAAALPRDGGRLDVAALVASGVAVAAVAVHPVAGSVAAAVAAVLHALRLWGWRGTAVAREPLLLGLHAGYAWLAVGYALWAASALPGMPGPGWAVHGLLAGAVGTMTLVVMARATLGHTGRPLRAGATLTVALVAVQVAAVARLSVPWVAHDAWSLAGGAWCLAFLLLLLRCLPMVVRPRVA